MKKTYVKPMIQFEDFKISANIAGDCSLKTSTPSQMSCSISVTGYDGDKNIFLSGISACTTIESDGDNQYSLCYHMPTDSRNLFNS